MLNCGKMFCCMVSITFTLSLIIDKGFSYAVAYGMAAAGS